MWAAAFPAACLHTAVRLFLRAALLSANGAPVRRTLVWSVVTSMIIGTGADVDSWGVVFLQPVTSAKLDAVQYAEVLPTTWVCYSLAFQL